MLRKHFSTSSKDFADAMTPCVTVSTPPFFSAARSSTSLKSADLGKAFGADPMASAPGRAASRGCGM